jgi:hypothetical protein
VKIIGHENRRRRRKQGSEEGVWVRESKRKDKSKKRK